MSMQIDFTKGGYEGDVVEETFKPFTVPHVPFWWQFREVLRASDRASHRWKKSDGTDLSDDAQRELVALSLLHYTVYHGIAEAITFFEQMGCELSQTVAPGWRIFQVRRSWKAMYSSLYTSFNALCNVVCVVVGQKSPFGEDPTRIWNYTPKRALDLVKGRGIKALVEPIGRCRERLEIRDHLDHYWTIWLSITQGRFMMDENFEKGYVAIRPKDEVLPTVDAHKLASDHLVQSAQDFNLIYREIAVKDGYLDQYLSSNKWMVDYSDYGPPHDKQRPMP
jgi:hypothetical protein